MLSAVRQRVVVFRLLVWHVDIYVAVFLGIDEEELLNKCPRVHRRAVDQSGTPP